MKTNWVKVVVLGWTLALAAASSANAGWGSWGGYGSGGSGGDWGGSWGGSGGSWGGGSGGSWGGYGSGGSGGHVGPLRRLAMRIHEHRAHRLAMRASYGSHGSWGGGSHGSWGGGSHGSWGGGSYGSSGWHGGYGSGGYGSGGSTGFYSAPAVVHTTSSAVCACEQTVSYGGGEVIGTPVETVIEGTPTESGIQTSPIGGDTVPAEPQPADSTSRAGDRAAVLSLNVPADAKVFINGNATKSQGTLRRFVSRGLQRGYQYRYEIRAEVPRNGKVVDLTKLVTLRAGKASRLSFDFEDSAASLVETSLTLRVPENAKVILSGTETKAMGSVRKFRTDKIAKGIKWSDYLVEVIVDRNGQKLTKHQQITINGGDRLELSFDFDETKVADAR